MGNLRSIFFRALSLVKLNPKRYDLGNKMDWLKTNFDVALMRSEFRDELISYIRDKLKKINDR